MKILIIEDEVLLAQSISDYLSGEQYLCEIAVNYAQAIEKTELYDYDCILLDLMLPGGDGLSILEALRINKKQDGVVIISAKGALDDKIRGLKIGADDYLSKPFHLPELAARVFSVIRRKNFDHTNIISQQGLEINIPGKSVSINNTIVALTKKEFDLLLYFISNKNRVVSKNALAEHLLGDVADMLDNYDIVYAHVKNLKKKLADAGGANCLKTIYGSGYKWES